MWGPRPMPTWPIAKAAPAPTTTVPDLHASQPPPTPPPSENDDTKYGTHIMGAPSEPYVHPDNQRASLWNAADQQQQPPYVHYSPITSPAASSNPFEPVIGLFNTWGNKAETIAKNIWLNLKTGHSVSEAAWGKVNLTAKALTEGGFEGLFKQIFAADNPNEVLKKTFACYLSTSTGPVAGTMYLSTARVAFCSNRSLTFTAPSRQSAWSYYKVVILLTNVGQVNQVEIKASSPERYLQIVTIDGHEFWFMGFVNFEKACHNVLESVSNLRAAGANEAQQAHVA